MKFRSSRIMKYVPKTKREAVDEAYRDDDGYWIILKEGWEAERIDRGCRVICQDTVAELRYQIGGIRRCEV